MRHGIVGLAIALTIAAALAAQTPRPAGVALADLPWPEAERQLTSSAVVVLPLGGAAVQHGPHLRLDSDERLVRHLAARVQSASAVVIAPPVTYHFYPAFLEYPGSTSLSQNTARDMTAEIVRTLANYGPRRFYVLNTGSAAMFALKGAADAVAADGILLGYTDMRYHLASARVTRRQTPRAALHADEPITSMMLAIDAGSVDMSKAVREYGTGTGVLTRQKDAPGILSTSGVVGDPTIASKEQGQIYVDALVAGVLDDIEALRSAQLPVARPATAVAAPRPAPRPQPERPSEEKLPNGCTASEERAARAVGERFSSAWRQMDAEGLSRLFMVDGDMRHPDGTIERGSMTIFQNRVALFRQREYRGSVHPVQLNDMRCLPGGTIIADGKWELRFETEPAPNTLERGLPAQRLHAGWCTLILVRTDPPASWQIQAWRYTVNPPDGEPAPTTLKQPGFLGRGGGH